MRKPIDVTAAGRVVAIIPARRGSKGIAGKNLASVSGKPLLAYSIDAARRAPEIAEVVVSTDGPEIAAFSRAAGATVIDRPEEIAGDSATSESALLHAIDHLRMRDGADPDLVVFLQATSPLRPPGAVSAAILTLLQEGADSLFSASPLHGFVWRLDDTGPVPVNYDHRARPRRQEVREHVEENGSIYAFRPWVLRTTASRLGGRIAVYRMDPLYALQVDMPEDLARAERLLTFLGNGQAEAIGDGGSTP